MADEPDTALDRYLDQKQMTFDQLGELAGFSGSTINRALRGKQNYGAALALAVERATNGAITADEFNRMALIARRAELGIPPPSEEAVSAA
jgi:DNA-binding transcriptional regulator YdaS (Cro superfamily)